MASRLITVSFSEIDSFRQCPLKHQLQYMERWRDRPKEGSARDKGTLWHSVLEAHYRAIMEHQAPKRGWTVSEDELNSKIADGVFPLLFHPSTGEYLSDMHELVHWMYQGYVEQYRLDPDWRILAVEHGPVVPLFDGERKTRFRLKTKIDLIIKDLSLGGHVWVVDHKSGKDLPAQKELDLDDQFSLYTLALRRQGKKVFGQLYNANRTQRNKTGVQTLESRMSRSRLYREDVELANVERDVVAALKEAYRARPPGVDARSNPNPQTCKWKCDFVEPHIASRKSGRSMQEMVKSYGFEVDMTRH